MDTQSAQVEQLPKALRSFIRAGTYFQKVLDTAEVNAQARAAAGQPPNLLDDVMKDGQVHIANLEEVLADITGRTKAKTVVELMTHAHGLMGIYNSVSDMFSGADEADAGDRAGDPRRASSQASAQANGASSPTFRPEFTGAARRAAKAAASAASAPRPHEATAAAAPPTAHEATPVAPAHAATAPETTPRMSLEDTLNALTMNVARHLQAFEQSVDDEQTALRGRMMHQSLEAAGLRARIQVLESKLMPAEEHPVTAALVVEPTAAPVAAPVNERATRTLTEPAINRPAEPQPHQAANVDPATSDTHGDVVDATVAAYAAKVSGMIIDSHTRVQTKLMEDRAQSVAYDAELLKLRTAVIRLEGLAENNTAPPPDSSDGQRLAEGDQGPPSEPRFE